MVAPAPFHLLGGFQYETACGAAWCGTAGSPLTWTASSAFQTHYTSERAQQHVEQHEKDVRTEEQSFEALRTSEQAQQHVEQHDCDQRLAAAAAADGRRERVEQPGSDCHASCSGRDALQTQQRFYLPACKVAGLHSLFCTQTEHKSVKLQHMHVDKQREAAGPGSFRSSCAMATS